MIRYGRLLKEKEKDNTTAFCRASYLFSNVGDLVKCWGKREKLPNDAKLYEAEMKLAVGDILMQCRMIEEEIDGEKYELEDMGERLGQATNTDVVIIAEMAATIMKHLVIREENKRKSSEDKTWTTREMVSILLINVFDFCRGMGWKVEDIEHLGYLHVMERFEQFEREGWK